MLAESGGLLDESTLLALSQVSDLDKLDSELQALQKSIEEELASISTGVQEDTNNASADASPNPAGKQSLVLERGQQQQQQQQFGNEEDFGRQIASDVFPLIESNPEGGLKKLNELIKSDPEIASYIIKQEILTLSSRRTAQDRRSLDERKDRSQQEQLEQASDLLAKIKLVSRWLMKSAFRKLARTYRQNDISANSKSAFREAKVVSYEGTFGQLAELLGFDSTLKALIDHRSTLIKLQVNRIADDLQVLCEAPLMELKQEVEGLNDDAESSCSVVVTLEDVQVEPSLLMERAMDFLCAESPKDTLVYTRVRETASRRNKKDDQTVVVLQLKDYLKSIYEPVLLRQLQAVYKKALQGEYSGTVSQKQDRLLNFRNFQRFSSLISKLVEIGALSFGSVVTMSIDQLEEPQMLTVSRILKDLERTYLSRLVNSYLKSESQRMFEFLSVRTQQVFEQVNQRHVVQQGTIQDVLEQEAKMVVKTSPVSDANANSQSAAGAHNDLSKTQAEGQQQLNIVENSSTPRNNLEVAPDYGEDEVCLGSEDVEDSNQKQLLIPADPSLQQIRIRQKSQNRRNLNYAEDAKKDAAVANQHETFEPSPRETVPREARRPPIPSANVSREGTRLADNRGFQFGRNNKVVPLVMKSVQNATQSLRNSQQLAMGTLKMVPSEQRIGDRTRATVEKNQSGSLIRLGKQTTEIDINFAASQNSEAAYGAVNLEKQLFAQRKLIQEERLRIRASNQSQSRMSSHGRDEDPRLPRKDSASDVSQTQAKKQRFINRAGGPYLKRDIKSPEYHLQLLRAHQAESNASSSQYGPPQPASKKSSSLGPPRQVKDVDFDFATLQQASQEIGPGDGSTGKVNQGLHDFFRLVADPMCNQLLKGLHTISLTVADSFLQSIKAITIQICNNLLVTIQQRPPLPEDIYYGMYAELSQANKACAISLAALTDSQVCTLLNELLYTRAKCEQYYARLAKRLSKQVEQHHLRKPIAELQMKTLQGVGTLRESFIAHIVARLETTCLASLLAQNWGYHKESFTSTSWIGASKQVQVVSPFENSKYLRYMKPKDGKKHLVLSPSRGLTAWRLQLIALRRDLTRWLAPFSQPNRVLPTASRNTLASHIYNRVLTQSCLSILAKLLTICPSRARSRQYTLDLAYFNWCVQNHIQLVALELFTALHYSESSPESEESPCLRKDSLGLATSILTLHLVHQTTQSALMLLCTDTCADASNSQIKELLSACLSRRAQIPSLLLQADALIDFHNLITTDALVSKSHSQAESTNIESVKYSKQKVFATQSQSVATNLQDDQPPVRAFGDQNKNHQTNMSSSIQMDYGQKPSVQEQAIRAMTDGRGSEIVVNGSTVDQFAMRSNNCDIQAMHRALLESLMHFFDRVKSAAPSSASLADLSAQAFFGSFIAKIAPDKRNLFGSAASMDTFTLMNMRSSQKGGGTQLRGSFMNPLDDEELNQNSNQESSLPPIVPLAHQNANSGVTPGAGGNNDNGDPDGVDFADAVVVMNQDATQMAIKSRQQVTFMNNMGSGSVQLKSQRSQLKIEQQHTSIAGITPGKFDFESNEERCQNGRQTLGQAKRGDNNSPQDIQRGKTLSEHDSSLLVPPNEQVNMQERLKEEYEQVMAGFFNLKPAQVIQEFKIAVEDCSSAPFTLQPFLTLRGSLHNFGFHLMPAKLILTFLNKRFDLSESETAHPPLTKEQASVRAKLLTHIAAFRENSGVADAAEIKNNFSK